MKLIPLEEVTTAISSSSDLAELVHLLYKLPSIDPISTIDEMIEDNKETLRKGTTSNLEFTDLIAQKYILEKLKSRLISNK